MSKKKKNQPDSKAEQKKVLCDNGWPSVLTLTRGVVQQKFNPGAQLAAGLIIVAVIQLNRVKYPQLRFVSWEFRVPQNQTFDQRQRPEHNVT